jgi:hypothetical protein
MEGVKRKVRGLIGSYILYGPFFAYLSVILSSGFLNIFYKNDVGIFIFSLYYIFLPAFYIFGLFPAIFTALLTEGRIEKFGYCSWLRSGLYGSMISALMFGGVALVIALGKFIRFRDFTLFRDPLLLCAIEVWIGFFGTISAWYLTRERQKEIAAAYFKRPEKQPV